MKNEALTNHLHDAFLRCGEILPAADIARKTRELEFDLEVEFDAQTVLASVREAGELFVDSMIQNEHDTEEAVTDGLYCGFTIDPLEARVAKWENMRPSAIPAYKIMRSATGERAVVFGSQIIPADIAGLATGKDAWLASIECKCRDCKRSFPLRLLQGGGQWCEECQAASIDAEE